MGCVCSFCPRTPCSEDCPGFHLSLLVWPARAPLLLCAKQGTAGARARHVFGATRPAAPWDGQQGRGSPIVVVFAFCRDAHAFCEGIPCCLGAVVCCFWVCFKIASFMAPGAGDMCVGSGVSVLLPCWAPDLLCECVLG